MSGKDNATSAYEKFEMAMADVDFLRERLKYGFRIPSTGDSLPVRMEFVSFYNGYCMAKGRMRK